MIMKFVDEKKKNKRIELIPSWSSSSFYNSLILLDMDLTNSKPYSLLKWF